MRMGGMRYGSEYSRKMAAARKTDNSNKNKEKQNVKNLVNTHP
jgi:hypothetical protein